MLAGISSLRIELNKFYLNPPRSRLSIVRIMVFGNRDYTTAAIAKKSFIQSSIIGQLNN